jgi:NDP-mannose synthase
MMAIIMAGGKGTRLKPYTMSIPKPLLPLGDIPILEIVLKQLAKVGFSQVVIALGHMASIFKISIGNGERFGLEIEYVMEEEPLGTVGALRLIDHLDDNFVVMNGDLLTDFDFSDFMKNHIENKAMASIGVHKRTVNIDYGVVETTDDGQLIAYKEKPTINYSVSMGINLFNKEAVKYIPSTGKFDIPDLMLLLREKEQKVLCYSTDCYWQDIGRFEDYEKASKDFVENPSFFI